MRCSASLIEIAINPFEITGRCVVQVLNIDVIPKCLHAFP